MKKLAIYLILSLLVFSGCEKDNTVPEEITPAKEELLCREWQREKYTVNGEEEILDIEATLEFKNDGSLTDTYHYEDRDIVYVAEWRFTQDKKYIEMSELNWEGKKSSKLLPPLFKSIYGDEEWTEYEILRLTAKEFFIVQHLHPDYILGLEYKAK